MNKTNYLILTLILCFSVAFIVCPIKTNALSEEGQAMIDALKEKYPEEDPTPDPTPDPTIDIINDPVTDTTTDTTTDSTIINYTNPIMASPNIDSTVVFDEFLFNQTYIFVPIPTTNATTDTTTDTTKEKEEKTYPYKACAGGCKEGQCVYHQSTDPSRSDECQSDADCRAPTPPAQYSCNQCRGTTCSVRYSSSPCSNTCITDADCRVPTPPSNGGTPPSNGGTPPSNGWTPPSNGGTPSPPTGGWTPPPPPPKYSCNQSTWTCYQNSSGPYSSLSSCQSACVEPPCMINYFEFPKRAWVGYSITGRWSASDWCVDCDVTCTPYPECVWKQDNIGTGFDEHEFTLEQSGDYIYTLTCYKQGGRDQKQVTVSLEALNLPWWREIIPVLPGFLRGIWK